MSADTLCVVYQYDPDTDHLVPVYVSSRDHRHVVDLRMPVGERLSGWVAATRQTIANSDPALDLGAGFNGLQPPPRNTLSTSLITDGALVAV